MLRVVNVEQMRAIEERTFDKQNIRSFDLMVHVGKEMYSTYKVNHNHDDILVIAGTGNNGGDALVFGEQAHLDGHKVMAFLIGDANKQSKESLAMTKRYTEKGIPLKRIVNQVEWDQEKHHILDYDLLIDGLFGIGLDRAVTGLYKEVINSINQMHKAVISMDVPSGLHADTGIIMGDCIRNTHVFTVHAIKQGLILEDAVDVVKDLSIIDVNMEDISSNMWLETSFYGPPKRKANSHKYHYKNVLTIGGQKGVMGAITLAGISALRSGVGLSTIACKEDLINATIVPYPELMVEGIKDQDSLRNIKKKKDAVLFGLGMRDIGKFEQMVFTELCDFDCPLVIDAAGIQLLKAHPVIKSKRIVLTPHYGEFARFMDVEVKDLKENLIDYVKKFLSAYPYELILKGPTSIYANKDKIIFLNQGTKALAKAGSGDVLAGIVLTYLARDLPLEQAVLLHMLAGREAERSLHTESVLASDIIEKIPSIYKRYKEEEL